MKWAMMRPGSRVVLGLAVEGVEYMLLVVLLGVWVWAGVRDEEGIGGLVVAVVVGGGKAGVRDEKGAGLVVVLVGGGKGVVAGCLPLSLPLAQGSVRRRDSRGL